MTDTGERGPEQVPSWRSTSWAQTDMTTRPPLRSRLRWPITVGAVVALFALVIVGLVIAFTNQARTNKQVTYDVSDIGNSLPGLPHTGPLLAFLPQIPGSTLIADQPAMANGDLGPVHFAFEDQLHPWQTVVRGAYRAVTVNGLNHYEFRLFQFRDASAAEKYASMTVGNWRTGPFISDSDSDGRIRGVPSGYVLAEGPQPDNSTNVYALALRGDIVLAIFGNQPVDKSTSAIQHWTGEVYARL